MPTTIDSLQIQIESNAKNAQSGIDALSASLDKLAQATRGGAGLVALNKKLDALSATINKVSASTNRLKELSDALGSLKAVENIKIPGRIGSQLTRLVAAINAINSSGFERITELSNALASLANLKDVRISSNLATQLSKLGEAAKSLSGVDLSVFGNLAETLHPLSEIGDISNFISVLSRLKKLPDIMNNLNAGDVAEFAQKVQQLTAALAPLATQMNSISSAFANFPSQVQQTAQRIGTVAQTNRQTANSYMNLWSAMQVAWHSMRGIGDTIMEWIQSSNEYIEDVNLFTASLGQYAQQAQVYAEKVGEIVGIDPGEWMKAQGVFYNLADGFGIASDRAYTMSQQLTQLSYDLASFYNLRVEDAMLKLRGALSGEIEMMRQLGVDLSNAAMQERANAMGIQTKVTAMTQAEKAQLRYLIMMERTTTAQGDMARTLDTPANQLRVLSAQATQAARALGNVFVPVLNLILPIAIAVAKAIRMVAAAIASLFGYSLPEIDYSGIGEGLNNAAGGAGKLDDNLGGAADKAKKLKSYLMGFDELNVINPDDNDSSSGGSGSGGGGGGGGFDWDLPTYDFLGDLIDSRVDEMMKKFQPFIDWVLEHLDGILAVAEAIGVAFLEWKIAKALIPDIGTIRADLSKVLSLAVAAAAITIMAKLVYQFDNEYMETGKWGHLIADGISTAMGAYISGKAIQASFGGKSGLYTASAALAVSTGVSLKVLYDGISENGITKEAIVMGIWSTIKGGATGGLLALAMGASTVAGVAVGAVATLGIGLVLSLVAYSVHEDKMKKALMWGKITLTAAEIKTRALQLFTIDVPTTIKIIDTQIENEEAAKTALNTAITNFNAGVNKILVGAQVEPDFVNNLVSELTGPDGVIKKLEQTLEAQDATVELAVSLVPPKDEEGNDLSQELLDAMGMSSEFLTKTGNEIGEKLSAAMQEGLKTGFSNGERNTINELTGWLNRISEAATRGKVSGEYMANVKMALSDLSPDSLISVIDQFKEYDDQITDRFSTLEKQSYANAIARKAELEESLRYYESLGSAGVANANEARELLMQLDSVITNWDYESSWKIAGEKTTAAGHQELIKAFEEIYNPAATATTQSGIMQRYFDGWKNASEAELAGESFESLAVGFKSKLEDAFHLQLTAEDSAVIIHANEMLGIDEWDVLGADIQTELYNSLVGAFDIPTAQGILNEAGYSMSSIVAKGISEGTIEIVSASQNAITLAGETIGNTTLELTPELQEIFKSFGIDISAYLPEGIEEGTPDAVAAAENLANEVTDAAATSFDEASATTQEVAKNSGVETGNAYVEGCATELENGQSAITAGAETAVSGVNEVMDGVDVNAGEKLDNITEKANTTSMDVSDTMKETFNSLSESATTSFGEINTSAQTTIGELATWVKTNVTTPIAQDFGTLATNIQTALTAVKTNVQTAWNELPGWVTSSIKTPISTTFSLLQTEIETGMTTAKTNVQTTWAQMSTWFSSNVVQPMIALFKAGTTEINRSFSTMSNDIVTSMNTMSTKVSAAFTTAKNSAQKAWNDMPSYMSGIASRMANSLTDAGWYSAGQSAAWQFKSGFESIQIQANVQSSSKSNGNVRAYASGGFPSTGQLFVAREAGAEMVGSIRGRTAVANNDQIVAGVSEGVYEAVTAALAENAGNQNITINLDGKVIYQNQQKVAKTVGYQFAHY